MSLLRLFLTTVILAVLSSCGNVVYKEAMPQNLVPLVEFPNHLRGIYMDPEGDTLVIQKDSYTYGNMRGSSIFAGTLCADIVLKQLDNFYFLSFKSEDGYWESIAASADSSYLYLYFVGVENEDQLKILNSHMKKSSAKSLQKEGKYIISPSAEELMELLNDKNICKVSKLNKLK